MSEETKDDAAAGVPKKSKGGFGLVLGILLPALASAGAAFGAVKATNKAHAGEHDDEPKKKKKELKPPGPTVALEPFLVNVPDEHKKAHPLKLTVAVEFDEHTKEDALKAYTPRIRDAILSHVRTMTYEQAIDHEHADKLRAELLKRCEEAGATNAERVLVTDLVTQ